MPSSNLKGISAMLIAVVAFSTMDATLKYLGQSYPPLQVSSLRGFASLPFLLATVLWSGRGRQLKPMRWPLHLLRGGLSIVMLTLFIYSIRTLSLSSAYSIFLCAPILITALSVPVFGERVDSRRWGAIAVGLVGVLLMTRPIASEVITLGALAALAAAILYACGSLLIRTASKTEDTLSLTFSFLLIMALGAGALALPHWVAVQTQHWPFIAIIGIAGAIAQYSMIEAFRHAPASVVAPFDYTQLLWGAIFDLTIWNTLPTTRTLIGGSVVVASGLYLIFRERSVNAQLEVANIDRSV